MNRALFSKAFLLPVALAWLGLLLLVPPALGLLRSAGAALAPSAGNLAASTFAFAALGCFLHEKIARCTSSLLERALRFGSFAFLVAAGPLLPAAYASWGAPATVLATALGLCVSILAFAGPVHLLYRFNPKGDSAYFSLAQKFQERVE